MNKEKSYTKFYHKITKKFFGYFDFFLGLDKYVKRFTISKFIALMIYVQIKELKSLRDISTTINSNEELKNINSKHLDNLLKKIINAAHVHLKPSSIKNTLENLYIIDSSTISMCLSKYPWAKYKKQNQVLSYILDLSFMIIIVCLIRQ